MDVVETMAGRNMFKRKAGDIRNVNNVNLELMLDILDILRLLLCLWGGIHDSTWGCLNIWETAYGSYGCNLCVGVQDPGIVKRLTIMVDLPKNVWRSQLDNNLLSLWGPFFHDPFSTIQITNTSMNDHECRDSMHINMLKWLYNIKRLLITILGIHATKYMI